jgi:erythromycin esterase
VFGIWSNVSQVKPLFDYVGKSANSASPLELTGFDCQLTGTASRDSLIPDLESFLAQNHSSRLNDPDWYQFKDVLFAVVNHYWYTRGVRPPEKERDLFFRWIDPMIDEISGWAVTSSDALRSSAYWCQLLKSIKVQASTELIYSQDWHTYTKEDNNRRDVQMAQNLLWLADTFYPDRKIIAWGATLHTAHNIKEIDIGYRDINYLDRENMGTLIWKALASRAFSLGFTAYQGTFGNPWSTSSALELPSAGSLEDLANSAGLENAVIDFRNISGGGEWLGTRLVSRPLGYTPMRARWNRILDGMVYTRVMIPSSY